MKELTAASEINSVISNIRKKIEMVLEENAKLKSEIAVLKYQNKILSEFVDKLESYAGEGKK